MPQVKNGSSYAQGTLFDTGVDMVKLRARHAELAAKARSENTERTYAHCMVDFGRWCNNAGRRSLPSTPETVALYVTDLFEQGKRVSTARVRVAAIADAHKRAGHPDPTVSDPVADLLSGAARTFKQRPQSKRALSPEILTDLSFALKDGTVRGTRDRALLVMGFSGGFRRSELARLELRDIRFEEQGVIVHIRWSKNDQRGEGRDVGIHRAKRSETCAVRLLQEWLRVRGDEEGPLFCQVNKWNQIIVDRAINGEMVNQALKRALRKTGMSKKEVKLYGAHSLRAGFVTTADDAGASIFAIQQRTGHKKLDTIARYVRPPVFKHNPLAKAL
jgi:integrase